MIGRRLVVLLLAATAAAPPAQDPAPLARRDALARTGAEGKRVAEAIGAGLQALRGRLKSDGAVGDPRGAATDLDALGATALALLAFAEDGQTTDGGPHEALVSAAAKWLAKRADGSGRLALGRKEAERRREPFLGHALATHALWEIGLGGVDQRYHGAAQQGLAFAVAARLADGTWPAGVGGTAADARTTWWMLHVVLSAQRMKLPLPLEDLEKLRPYVEGRLTDAGPGDEIRRDNAAAASLAVLAGWRAIGDEAVQAAADRVAAAVPEWRAGLDPELLARGTELMRRVGGERWAAWRTRAVVPAAEWAATPPADASTEAVAAALLAGTALYDGESSFRWDPAASR